MLPRKTVFKNSPVFPVETVFKNHPAFPLETLFENSPTRPENNVLTALNPREDLTDFLFPVHAILSRDSDDDGGQDVFFSPGVSSQQRTRTTSARPTRMPGSQPHLKAISAVTLLHLLGQPGFRDQNWVM